MNSEKTNLPSLRNLEWRTLKIDTNKINQVLPYISTNNITELNELIYAGAKLVCEKIGIPSKSTKKKSKPRWEIRLETKIKNLRKQTKMIKQMWRWNMWEQKGKGNTSKNNSTIWRIKPENTGERRKIKEILTKGKTIQTKQDIPKQRKKIISATRRAWRKNLLTTGCQRNRTILQKNMATKKHEKAEWINNMTRELEGLEEGLKAEIHIDLLKKTLKKSNWKTPGYDEIHGFLFKKFTSIHDWIALEMDRCLQGVQVPEWMTKGKTTLIKKEPSKKTGPSKYRSITCLPMMRKILTGQIRFTTRSQVADGSLRNRKDVAKDPEAQQNYFT